MFPGQLSARTNSLKPSSRDPTTVFPLDGVPLHSVTDDALKALLESSPILFRLGDNKIVRLSQDLVLKAGSSVLLCEAEVLRLIAVKLPCLRVPRVHRSFQVEDSSKYFGTMGYIVMDYIPGRPLNECWDSLADEARVDIVIQVAQMIRNMQSTMLSRPGPISDVPVPSRGQLFTVYSAGPFEGGREMEDWFNHKLKMCQHYKRAPQDLPPFKFTHFVLTHQDISPRNLILDSSGQVWMVDWADAGAYPPAFESAALEYQTGYQDFHTALLMLLPYDHDSTEVQQLRSIKFGLSTLAWA